MSENTQPTVLFADSNEAFADLVADYLSHRGFNVILSENGNDIYRILQDAFEKGIGSKPDIVLASTRLQAFNFHPCIRDIKQRFGNIPFVVQTGNPDVTLPPEFRLQKNFVEDILADAADACIYSDPKGILETITALLEARGKSAARKL